MRWNLQRLFDGPHDPRIKERIAALGLDVPQFVANYAGTLHGPGGPSAAHVLAAVGELERIIDAIETLRVFAELLMADDAENAAYQALSEEIERVAVEYIPQLMFFERELAYLAPEDVARLLCDPEVQRYRQYLGQVQHHQQHMLDEAVEQALLEKESAGVLAWKGLWEKIFAELSYNVRVDGQLKTCSLDDFTMLRRHSSREVRRDAHRAFYQALRPSVLPLSSVYDAVILDHIITDRLYGYGSPFERRNVENDIDPQIIETMLGVVQDGYPIAQGYFRFKASRLKIDTLEIYDQRAPLTTSDRVVDEQTAVDVILETLRDFSPQVYEQARFLVDHNAIDTEVRPGKYHGSFCTFGPYHLHPYISCGYHGHLEDLLELAHEIGHAIHFLFAREQTKFQSEPVTLLAETAALFVESLVLNRLVEQSFDRQATQAMLCSKVETTCFNIFYQHVIFGFEQRLFAEREHQPLTPETLTAYWTEAHRAYFGSAARFTEGYELGWAWLPSVINQPFYSYSYIFGEILAMALYRNHRQGLFSADDFVALLRAGSSTSIDDLVNTCGMDLYERRFWEQGIAELGKLTDLATALSSDQIRLHT